MKYKSKYIYLKKQSGGGKFSNTIKCIRENFFLNKTTTQESHQTSSQVSSQLQPQSSSQASSQLQSSQIQSSQIQSSKDDDARKKLKYLSDAIKSHNKSYDDVKIIELTKTLLTHYDSEKHHELEIIYNSRNVGLKDLYAFLELLLNFPSYSIYNKKENIVYIIQNSNNKDAKTYCIKQINLPFLQEIASIILSAGEIEFNNYVKSINEVNEFFKVGRLTKISDEIFGNKNVTEEQKKTLIEQISKTRKELDSKETERLRIQQIVIGYRDRIYGMNIYNTTPEKNKGKNILLNDIKTEINNNTDIEVKDKNFLLKLIDETIIDLKKHENEQSPILTQSQKLAKLKADNEMEALHALEDSFSKVNNRYEKIA